MKLNDSDSVRMRKICYHEAGHYVLAREKQFKTQGISVLFYFPKGHSGESGIEPWNPMIRTIPDIENYIKRRVQVLYAGAIAEAMDIDGNYDSEYALNEWKNGGSKNDYAKFRELIHVLRNISFPETTDEKIAQKQLNEIEDKLIVESGEIVQKRIKLIYKIGDLLFDKIKEYGVEYDLSEQEINKIPIIKNLYS